MAAIQTGCNGHLLQWVYHVLSTEGKEFVSGTFQTQRYST